MKRKMMLSGLVTLWALGICILFFKKSENDSLRKYKEDLRTAMLSYLEVEEVFPERLESLKEKISLDSYKLTYEIFPSGTGCRVVIAGKEEFELWLGE